MMTKDRIQKMLEARKSKGTIPKRIKLERKVES